MYYEVGKNSWSETQIMSKSNRIVEVSNHYFESVNVMTSLNNFVHDIAGKTNCHKQKLCPPILKNN